MIYPGHSLIFWGTEKVWSHIVTGSAPMTSGYQCGPLRRPTPYAQLCGYLGAAPDEEVAQERPVATAFIFAVTAQGQIRLM